jgi:hypothetical protein
VSSLAFDGAGRLIATGLFTTSGTLTVNHLAVWDGAHWKGFGSGLGGNGLVYGTRVVRDEHGFVVAGSFSSVDGRPATSIARWDGETWRDLGQGLSSTDGVTLIQDLALRGSGLFATGVLQLAGAAKASQVAWWDGARWHELGAGLDDLGGALALSDETLWVAGTFSKAGGHASASLAAWDL